VAECRAEWAFDEETRTRVWNAFKSLPEPLGYDPAAIGVPGWDSPTSPDFVVLKLTPWRLRVLPATFIMKPGGQLLTWQE
jgi:hypothetical protein